MSLGIGDFESFFAGIYGYEPYPWQSRLARTVFEKGWPECIDLPTASGKTATIDIAVFVLACQTNLAPEKRTAGRRIFFAVNRRVIVDEAFDRAKNLAKMLYDQRGAHQNEAVIKEVAHALRSINENGNAPPLDTVQLRGGIYRDNAWARSLTQPIIICTTADQLGSRILFRGYGVSDSMKPVHAALCACDSLVLLDEAHVTRAFSQTMQRLPLYQKTSSAPGLTFVQMTATPAGEIPEDKRFGLRGENWGDPGNAKLKDRQEADKRATLVKLDRKKPVIDEVVKRATEGLSEFRKAVGIIVNRVHTARAIEEKLRTELKEVPDAEIHLIIGRMRPIDRDEIQQKLRALVGPDRPDQLDHPVFIVATQCLEVGADYDFDVLITECASLDAIRQRFGRLNRRGRKLPNGSPFESVAAIVTNDESIKDDDPIYGSALRHTWGWLWSKKDEESRINFGIAAFAPLWQEVEREHQIYLDRDCPKPLLAPAPDAAILLPAHLDALCQTAPQPLPSPDVSYFIHGPKRDNAEVNVCWRADLGDDPEQWPEIVRLLPPTSAECMTVPLRDVRRWMKGEGKSDRDADVPVVGIEAESSAIGRQGSPEKPRPVVIWRGVKEAVTTTEPRELRPGDTVAMPVGCRSWLDFGHIPYARASEYEQSKGETDEQCEARGREIDRSVDIAEKATRQARRRVVVRIHPAFPDHELFRGLRDAELREALALRAMIPQRWNEPPVARVESHFYNEDDAEIESARVIVFKRLLEPKEMSETEPEPPAISEDDDGDNLSELDLFVSLESHTQHVVERADAALKVIGLRTVGHDRTIRAAAQLHDLGKSDCRFQAMLAGITPAEAMERPSLLGKGDGQRRTQAEKELIRQRALLPRGFRHEMLSMQVVDQHADRLVSGDKIDPELLLHLIASHHGHARPFASIVIDEPDDVQILSLEVNGVSIDPAKRRSWTPTYHLDSGIPERFWKLTREHGWWGLAWLEAILRLADQQASANEQSNKGDK